MAIVTLCCSSQYYLTKFLIQPLPALAFALNVCADAGVLCLCATTRRLSSS